MFELNDHLDSADPNEIYASGMALAKEGNLKSWRKLSGRLAQHTHASLAEWRSKYEPGVGDEYEKLSAATDEAVAGCANFIVFSLCGVESRSEDLRDQRAALYVLVDVPGWNWAGRTRVLELPYTLGYVFQCLYGALSIYTRQLDLALGVSEMPVRDRYSQNYDKLWTNHGLVGWAETLGGNCAKSWEFVAGAFARWDWLGEFFASEDDYREALVSYYMCLNVQELAFFISRDGFETVMEHFANLKDASLAERIEPAIPLDFMQESTETKDRAFRSLMLMDEHLPMIWKRYKVSGSEMEQAWQGWMLVGVAWANNVYQWGFLRGQGLPHADLFRVLKP